MQNSSLLTEAVKINPSDITPLSQKRQVWEKIISDWKKSNLSQRAFCENHGLNLGQFSYYRGSFHKSACKTKKMMPIQISEKPTQKITASDNPFTLYLPNDIKLMIPQKCEIAALKNIFSAIGVGS